MNFASSLCRRLNIKELVTNVPVYRSTADVSGEGLSLVFRRWATKKTAGSTKNGRDSNPKNLGVKKFGGERVIPGNIIVRQRGTRFHPGNYVGLGKDHTLFALKEGWVKFERNKLTGRKWVHIVPKEGHVLHPVFADVSASEPKDLYGRKVRVNYATEKPGPGFSGGEFSINSNLGYDGELDSQQDDCIRAKKVLLNLRSLLTNLEGTPCKKQETCGF